MDQYRQGQLLGQDATAGPSTGGYVTRGARASINRNERAGRYTNTVRTSNFGKRQRSLYERAGRSQPQGGGQASQYLLPTGQYPPYSHHSSLNGQYPYDYVEDINEEYPQQDQLSHTQPQWSWKPVVLAAVAMTLFASIFGAFGLLFGSLAYTDHKVGDYGRSKTKIIWTWFCSIFGIIVSLVVAGMLLLLVYQLSLPRPTFEDAEYWVPPWLLKNLDKHELI